MTGELHAESVFISGLSRKGDCGLHGYGYFDFSHV